MKFLLINPPQKNFFKQDMTQHIAAEESGAYPPLGLLSLATYIIEKGKHEVKIVDAIAENLNHKEIAEVIKKENPDAIGITCTTEYLRDAVIISDNAKEINPDIKIIIGGHHVDLYPRETAGLKNVDCVVIGDGEPVINELLDRIDKKQPLEGLPGVITKTNIDEINFIKLKVENLDELPILKRDIIDFRKYRSVLAKSNPITTMIGSRGCPFNCPYCSGGNIPLRNNSVTRFVDEIESCLSLGIKDIFIFDETFTLRRDRVHQICEEIQRRSLNFRWHARTRIDCIDRETVKKMKKSGCRLLQFGIETATPRIQKILRRNMKIEKIREVIKMVKEEGILTYGNFMINLPTETREDMERTIDFAVELDLDYAVFSVLSLYPGTEFYANLLNEGKIKEDFWRRYAKDPLSYEVENVFYPNGHSNEELNNMIKKAYNRFYFRPSYILKTISRDESFYQKYLQLKSGIRVILRFLGLK